MTDVRKCDHCGMTRPVEGSWLTLANQHGKVWHFHQAGCLTKFVEDRWSTAIDWREKPLPTLRQVRDTLEDLHDRLGELEHEVGEIDDTIFLRTAPLRGSDITAAGREIIRLFDLYRGES